MIKNSTAILLSLCILALLGCESFDGLQPVVGLEGNLEFTGTWPDSIEAAALVVFDSRVGQDMENISDYLLTYTNPTRESGEYFVQLEPGVYIGAVVGLLMDPGYFAANIEEVLSRDELPLVILSDITQGGVFSIQEDTITGINWLVDFN